jgi:2-polyprenyl-3-methyl-5-hydroxy-6-metoxy-1,4-benzoquinol methylase/spore coat polysaccharide biosynthesis predicted glycosyltransferase SpsG
VSRGPILAVPAIEPGRGGGHLIRCLALIRDLRGLGREAWLFLTRETKDLSGIFNTSHFDDSCLIAGADLQAKAWDCIILDRFHTPPQEFERWAGMAPLIGIDEGGPCRDRFDFLIDILPGLSPGGSKPNIADPSLLPLSAKNLLQRRRSSINEETYGASAVKVSSAESAGNRCVEDKAVKVLISFGHEDSAGLGPAAARALADKNHDGVLEITLLAGGMPRSRPSGIPAGIRMLETIPELGTHLAEYDLLITHYGLTAFEAVYAETPVLLISPGTYHEKLAKAAGFHSAGRGIRGAAKLSRRLFKKDGPDRAFLQNLEIRRAALARKHALDREPKQSLAALVNSFSPLVNKTCPVCGSGTSGPACNRGAERVFRRCKRCGVIFMNRLNAPPIEYKREYFFEFYQKQYGKTYIADFPGLIVTAKRRLAHIKALLPRGRLLLDIGCAYGPFLIAAREEGFSPAGIDPAEDAIRYVTQTLGIPAVHGFFPDCRLSGLGGVSGDNSLFDMVTLWYVIEHFQNCVPVFAEIRRILKPGGVLAFSSPSSAGVSGRSSLARFLTQSPADHWTIWSPAMCKKALALSGFKVKKIVVSGHHPERFPLFGKFARNKKSALYTLLLALSKIFALGDTFEVYAAVEELSDEPHCLRDSFCLEQALAVFKGGCSKN